MVIAVFDVDGTLIRGDSLKLYAWYVFRHGKIRYSYLFKFANILLKYLAGFGDASTLKRALLHVLVRGTTIDQALHLAERFNREVLSKRLYSSAAERIRWHRQEKHHIVVLSASPDVYLRVFAAALGARTLICTELASRYDEFTGDFVGENCKGEEKRKRLACAPTLGEAMWAESYGYGNSSE